MRNIFILTLISIFIISCSNNPLENVKGSENAIEKSMAFKSPVNVPENNQFLILEAKENGITSGLMGEVINAKVENSGNYTMSLNAYNAILENIKLSESNKQRKSADILFLTYWVTDKLFLSKKYTANPADCKKYLSLALSEANPVEWERLAQLFNKSIPSLTKEEYNNYKNFIVKGTKKFKSKNGYNLEESHYVRLTNSAIKAEGLLATVD